MKRILVLVCMVLFWGTLVSAACAADRFVNNKDGTVTDTKTGLMWADHDSGSDRQWHTAKSYCEGFSGGGKSGWRMPTPGELMDLHYSDAFGSVIKKTGSFVWSSQTRQTRGYEAAFCDFRYGNMNWRARTDYKSCRALPVWSVK